MVNSKIQEVFRLFQPTRIHDAIVFPGYPLPGDFKSADLLRHKVILKVLSGLPFALVPGSGLRLVFDF